MHKYTPHRYSERFRFLLLLFVATLVGGLVPACNCRTAGPRNRCYSLLVGKRSPSACIRTARKSRKKLQNLCWSNDTNRTPGTQDLIDGVCPHIVGWWLLLAAVTAANAPHFVRTHTAERRSHGRCVLFLYSCGGCFDFGSDIYHLESSVLLSVYKVTTWNSANRLVLL